LNLTNFSSAAALTGSSKKNKQKGFTMVELIVVITITAILSLLAVPAIGAFITEGKVEPTASDITKTVTKIRANAAGNGATPYAGLTDSVFAKTAKTLASSIAVNAAGDDVLHDLGGAGATNIAVIGGGTSFSVTMTEVNDAACPGLATQLSKAAETISINGTAVKAAGAAYQGATAPDQCTDGDTNTFAFTFR
jgi:type IV pilus assembly protein PilA